MSNELDLQTQVNEARQKVVELRGSLKNHTLDKTHLVRAARRELARLLTQLNKAGK